MTGNWSIDLEKIIGLPADHNPGWDFSRPGQRALAQMGQGKSPEDAEFIPLGADTGEVRFFVKLSDRIKINTKYKLKDMVSEGKLEY